MILPLDKHIADITDYTKKAEVFDKIEALIPYIIDVEYSTADGTRFSLKDTEHAWMMADRGDIEDECDAMITLCLEKRVDLNIYISDVDWLVCSAPDSVIHWDTDSSITVEQYITKRKLEIFLK